MNLIIPAEIINHIMGYVRYSGARTSSNPSCKPDVCNQTWKSDVMACSLVSSAWRGPSQRLLFSSFALDPKSPGKCLKLLLIPQHAHLTSHVENLYLDCIRRRKGDTPLDLHPEFRAFLLSLTRLRKISIYEGSFDWDALSRSDVEAFLHVLNLPSLRSLHFTITEKNNFPSFFVAFCPNVEYMALECPHIIDANDQYYPISVKDPKYLQFTSQNLQLSARPRPIKLSLAGIGTIDSFQYFLEKNPLNFVNNICLDRLRDLTICYNDEKYGETTAAERLGSFLNRYGSGLEKLDLTIFREDDEVTKHSIPVNDIRTLTNLRDFEIYVSILMADPFSTFAWEEHIMFLLRNLPPCKLEKCSIRYEMTSFGADEDLQELVRNWMNMLDDVLSSRFPRLRYVRIRLGFIDPEPRQSNLEFHPEPLPKLLREGVDAILESAKMLGNYPQAIEF